MENIGAEVDRIEGGRVYAFALPDTVNGEAIGVSGFVGAPVKGEVAVFTKYKGGYRQIGVLHPIALEEGERLIHSEKYGNSVFLNKDGEVVINGGTDYAVKFNELKEAFDELKADLNAVINTIQTVSVVEGAPVNPEQTLCTANLSNAKADKIRL